MICMCMHNYYCYAPRKPYYFPKIIAFGDSLTDTGGAYTVSKQILSLPNPPKDAYLKPGVKYWCNRYSNGPVAVERLACMLGSRLINYAIGGATTGDKNYSSWMDTLYYTGVLGQIDLYQKSLGGQVSYPEALYVIYAGTNDYYVFEDFKQPATLEEATSQAVANINTAIKKLASLGARNFLIVNCPNLSLAPYIIRTGLVKNAKDFTNLMNVKLEGMLSNLSKSTNLYISKFDAEKATDYIAQNATKYGITNLTTGCQPASDNISHCKYPCIARQCYFWDDFHYTTIVDKLMADMMYQHIRCR